MNKDLQKKMNALWKVIMAEAEVNAEFADKLEDALESASIEKVKNTGGKRAANRRDAAVFNPMELILKGEEHLREQLEKLDEKELKDIIADYGMDPAKLAMKWKDKGKLIEKIIETAKRRSTKGDAFREVSE